MPCKPPEYSADRWRGQLPSPCKPGGLPDYHPPAPPGEKGTVPLPQLRCYPLCRFAPKCCYSRPVHCRCHPIARRHGHPLSSCPLSRHPLALLSPRSACGLRRRSATIPLHPQWRRGRIPFLSYAAIPSVASLRNAAIVAPTADAAISPAGRRPLALLFPLSDCAR